MTLQQALQAGVVLHDEFILDAHAHMGPWHNFHVPEGGSAASMVNAMDLAGFNCAVVSPHIAIGPDYRRGNRDVAAAAQRFPGRIIPFVTLNPNAGRREIEEEIAYWDRESGIVAFKIHPACHECKASVDAYFPVYEFADAHGLPVLSHSWAGDPLGGASTLGGLAEQFPRAQFIIGHAASSWQVLDEAEKEARQRDNIHLDLTGSRLIYGLLEDMVRRVGAERVLFGTDMPFIDPRPGLGRVLMARLDDDDKRLILGLNAKRLFGL